MSNEYAKDILRSIEASFWHGDTRMAAGRGAEAIEEAERLRAALAAVVELAAGNFGLTHDEWRVIYEARAALRGE